jgi:hypothetical protein
MVVGVKKNVVWLGFSLDNIKDLGEDVRDMFALTYNLFDTALILKA